MARILLETEQSTEELTLDNLVPKYAETKAHADNWKKASDELNTTLKNLLMAENKDSHTSGGYTAKMSTQHRETINEEKLIHLLEHSTYHTENCAGPICIATGLGIVKMKPYVDMEALEDAIYKGLIPQDVLLKMSECKEVKDVVTLRVTKEKKKSEDE